MNLDRRTAVAALAGAGLLWGTSVPLTKLALDWLPPAWLTVTRFGLAAVVLLFAVRFRVGAAWSPAVLGWGAVGYGGSILVQNAGITRTSVSHAALLVGATPVLVAVLATLRHRRLARPVAWAGAALSFGGVGLVAAGGGGGSTFAGDALVLASLVLSAAFTVAQAGLLPGRDPVAVTALQFLAAAVAALPVAAATEGLPALPASPGALLAAAGLTLAGTLAPSTLFAYGQARVSAEVAGAFVNLEPLVGAAAGAAAFGDPVGLAQAAGGAAILSGIVLSSLPMLRPIHPGRVKTAPPPSMPESPRASAAPAAPAGSAELDHQHLAEPGPVDLEAVAAGPGAQAGRPPPAAVGAGQVGRGRLEHMDQARLPPVVLEADPVPGGAQPVAADDHRAAQRRRRVPVGHRGTVQPALGGRPEQHRVHRPVANRHGRHLPPRRQPRADRGRGRAGAVATEAGQPQRPPQRRRGGRRRRRRGHAHDRGRPGRRGRRARLSVIGEVQQPACDREPADCGQDGQHQPPSPPAHQPHPLKRAAPCYSLFDPVP